MGTKGVLGRGPKEEKPYIIPDRLLRGYFPTIEEVSGKMFHVMSHSLDYKTFSTS